MKRSAQHVECAEQIDIDDGLERVGGHAERRRHKIASRPGQNNIDLAVSRPRLRQRPIDGSEIAHIGRHAERLVARIAQALCCGLDLFGRSADQGDFGTRLGKAERHAEIDAAGRTGDESHLARQQAVA